MKHEYCAKDTPPPNDRPVLVQILKNYGRCDLNWYPVYFDNTTPTQDDLKVYDADDKLIGEVWFWKELD